MNTETSELERKEFTIMQYTYESPDQAKEIFRNLPDELKLQMAQVYQAAFGGYPWYERFVCNKCENYMPEDSCPGCNMENLQQAYPTDQLINDTFPNMMAEFTPGILLLSFTNSGELVGFSTGGIISLEELIGIKYKANNNILKDIAKQGEIEQDSCVFYDNETCILPSFQRYGIGKKLSETRVQAAIALGAEYICGRTINLPWLALKEKQLASSGYDFRSFVPQGESYQVKGVMRTFYLAKRKN